MFKMTDDGSVLSADDRVIFFSFKRFIAEIVQGNCCFICGAQPGTVPFNDEHVMPDWILRKFNLHNRAITLPNLAGLRYGQFRIPCCENCNKKMGQELEKPMSELFAGGYKVLAEYLKNRGPWFLFGWMCLIFLKTHLKDNALRFHKDRRKGEEKIGELHAWEHLHHIHCMARSFYTKCDLKAEVLGSLLVFPAKIIPGIESFDYGDLSFSQTMLLRIDDIAVISVLDDSNAGFSAGLDDLKKITGPLSPLQLREIAVRMAESNIRLAERPVFASDIDLVNEKCSIEAHRPAEIHFAEPAANEGNVLGQMMEHYCGPMIPDWPEKPEILAHLRTGRYSFILKPDGTFNFDHMDPD